MSYLPPVRLCRVGIEPKGLAPRTPRNGAQGKCRTSAHGKQVEQQRGKPGRQVETGIRGPVCQLVAATGMWSAKVSSGPIRGSSIRAVIPRGLGGARILNSLRSHVASGARFGRSDRDEPSSLVPPRECVRRLCGPSQRGI